MAQHCARTRVSDHSPRSPKEEGIPHTLNMHWFPVDSPGVRPDAIDPASAARLWTISAEFTGVNAFG